MPLSAKNLSATFGHYCVFKNLSFKVNFGQCLIIKGANGSGKTTLLNLLSTLTTADQGVIEFENQPIEKSSNYQQKILYLSDKNYLKENLSVKDNLQFLQALNRLDGRLNVEALLKKANLSISADQKIGELSQGQKKRLLLSQFFSSNLSNHPIWLLDEPLALLDTRGIALFEAMLRDHINGGGIALISSHQPIKLNCNTKTLEL